MNNDLTIKTNIGVVPSEWNKVKMDDIITEVTRFSKADNIPLYSLTINDGLICKPEKYEREFLVKGEEDNYKIIEKDEFALNPMNLRFGAIAKMKNNTSARLSKYYNIFKCNELVDSNFLEMFLKSERVLNYYNTMATGTLEEKKRVHFSQFIQFEFYLPILAEQRKIAEILSTWDLAIEKQEQLIEKKKEFKKGLMQRLLSGEVRFKEFKDEWKVVSLGSIFERVTQKNDIGCNNVLTISAQNGLVNQEEYFNKSVSSKDLSGYYLLSKGDFAYNKSYSNGYPLGAIKRLNNYEEGVVSPLYICFRAMENLSTCFYEQYFESGALNKEIVKIAQEGARNHGLLNISVTEFFKDIKIVRPSIEEQNKIAEVLISADKEIELLQKELEALKLQKKGLMQRLLTGEVRVKI